MVEGRCFVDVTDQGGNRSRATALAHAHRSDRLSPVAAVAEAAQDAWAQAAPEIACPLPTQILLPPRKAAQLTALAIRDIVTATRSEVGAVPELIDDGLAAGGPHARPFDVEGTPTGRAVLVGRDGRVRLPHARGTATGDDLLGGHASRQEHDTTPQPWPSNVVLASGHDGPADAVDEPSPRPDLPFCVGVVGADVMHLRTSDRLILALRVAARTDAGGVVRHRSIRVSVTSAELLRALTPITGPCAYVRGREFSTAGGWALLDLTQLRCGSEAVGGRG